MATKNCTACSLNIAQYLQSAGHDRCFTCITEHIDLGKILEDIDKKGLDKFGPGVCIFCSSAIREEDLSLLSHSSKICQNCYQLMCSNHNQDLVLWNLENEEKFMIKSSYKVLGPYTKKEIIIKIAKKEVTGLDEIVGENSYWHYLKDDETFAIYIKNQVKNFGVNEDTVDITTTVGLSKSREDLYANTDPSIAGFDLEKENQDLAIDITFLEQNQPVGVVGKAQYKDLKEEENRKRNFIILTLLFLISLLFLSYVAWQKYINLPTGDTKLIIEDAKKEAYTNLAYAEYDKALVKFGELYKSKDADFSIQFQYALLLMREKKITETKRILDSLLKTNLSLIEKTQIYLAYGIAFLLSEDLQQAEESFKNSIKLDKDNELAKLNLSDIYIEKQEIEKALDILPVNVGLERLEGVKNITLLRSILEYAKKNRKINSTFKADIDSISEATNIHYEYKQEILFLLAAIELELENELRANQYLLQAINVHPDLTSKHPHERLVYLSYVSWIKLQNIYSKYTKAYERNYLFNASYAYILKRNSDSVEASKYLAKAKIQNSDDLSLQALQLWMKNDKSSDRILTNFLQNKNGLNYSELYYNLAAEACYKLNDYNCALRAWDIVLLNNPSSLEAVTGKARLLFEKGDIKTAMEIVQTGLGRSPRYIPLLTLEQEISSESSN